MSNKYLYSIGEISQLCNIPIKTLRYYDKEGLLRPETRNFENNYRYYSEKQLLEIIIIKELKSLAFSLDDIKSIMRQKNLQIIQEKLGSKVQEIKDNILKLNTQLEIGMQTQERIIGGLNILELHEDVNENIEKYYKFELKLIPKNQIIYIRYSGLYKAKELFLRSYAELLKIRDKYQLHSSGPLMAIFHDHYTNQFFDGTNDLELCLPVLEKGQECPFVREFGGFQAIVTTHVGQYFDMYFGYLALINWINNNGLTIDGPAIEQYIIDPTNTDIQENYVTNIMFPIKPSSQQD